MLDDLLDAALAAFPVVVADVGPDDAGFDVVKRSDEAVLVSDTTAVGLVRTASLVAEWAGPPPALVLNRASSRRPVGAIAAARQWTGLEPAVVVPERPAIREAGLRGAGPAKPLLKALSPLAVPA
jgi:Flp pilus assembly CpaE family ATPase